MSLSQLMRSAYTKSFNLSMAQKINRHQEICKSVNQQLTENFVVIKDNLLNEAERQCSYCKVPYKEDDMKTSNIVLALKMSDELRDYNITDAYPHIRQFFMDKGVNLKVTASNYIDNGNNNRDLKYYCEVYW